MNLDAISSAGLVIAFVMYTLSFIFFVIAVTGQKLDSGALSSYSERKGRYGFLFTLLGLVFNLVYFVTRWIEAGHIPVSNLFEFMIFLGMMIMAAFAVLYYIYKAPILGAFATPVGLIMVAYAAVFPPDIQPLIPPLQSYWLYIHVTTAAAGEAFFAVAFAAGFMYLLRVVDYSQTVPSARREQRGIEFTLFVVLVLLGFIISVFGFRGADYHAQFEQELTLVDEKGVSYPSIQQVDYILPPLIKPYNSVTLQMDSFLGMKEPLFEAPGWMKGVNAGRKFNTILWSLISGGLLYAILRFISRKPLGAVLSPAMRGMDPEHLDEISYRAIAIGFPIFTLGALIFAMIWAQEAWGRFWGWDPKEVWALITFLFYAAYLHLRLSRSWMGKRSAWMTVIGFVIVMFTLIGVNLVLAGLHSYAGV